MSVARGLNDEYQVEIVHTLTLASNELEATKLCTKSTLVVGFTPQIYHRK